jgi:signal transduction histidine kinase
MLALAVAGLAAGLGAVALTLTGAGAPGGLTSAALTGGQGQFVALALVFGWGFIAVGLFARLRRPGSRIGALMAAVGFAWFFGVLVVSDSPLVFTIGQPFDLLWVGVLIQLMLAFPTGSLQGRLDRALVIAAYFTVTVVHVAPLLFADAGGLGCEACPSHLLLASSQPDLAAALRLVESLAQIAVGAAVGVILIVRWRRGSLAQRRALGPLLAAAGAAALLGAGFAASAALGLEVLANRLSWVGLWVDASLPLAFLAGLLRSRLYGASALTDLIERLGALPEPRRLREELANVLGDPTLGFAYWLPDRSQYVDTEGVPVALPGSGSARAATVIQRGGRPVAALVYDAALAHEPEFVGTAGGALALWLDNERLNAELHAHVHELRSSRARLVTATDAERRRIERDLHDGAQQRLVSLLLNVKLGRRTIDGDHTAATRLLDAVATEIAAALADLRALAAGILPPVLTDHGLGAAVEELAGRSPLAVEIEAMPERRLPDQLEVAAYFVIAEALANVAKHAGARRVSVRVARAGTSAVVEVRDDGAGGADPARGSGLRGLGDRVGALGGRLHCESPSGRGTRLTAEMPCER